MHNQVSNINRKQIEALIFDVGGVLWLPADTPLREKWAARCGLDAEAFDAIVHNHNRDEKALCGTLTREKLWENIVNELKLSPSDSRELEQDYWAGTWNTQLLEHLQTLKSHYKLGIISDTYTGAREALKEWVNTNLFKVIVFSAEEGLRKPDPRIFQRALERLGVAPSAAVFVDDRAKNVRGAQALGIHAIQYQDFAQLLADLDGYTGSKARIINVE